MITEPGVIPARRRMQIKRTEVSWSEDEHVLKIQDLVKKGWTVNSTTVSSRGFFISELERSEAQHSILPDFRDSAGRP